MDRQIDFFQEITKIRQLKLRWCTNNVNNQKLNYRYKSKEKMIKKIFENKNSDWDIVIKAKTGWFDINLKELWKAKDLIGMFVYRDFIALYKQTILGPLWYLIQPLFTAGVFTLIFGKLANISTDEIPQLLFYMSGTINWQYFSESLNKTAITFKKNANIFGKVYFPRLTVPISIVITNLLKYAIQFILFLVVFFIIYSRGAPVSPNLLALAFTPFLLIQMILLGLGFGIWISSITTKYRDLVIMLPFFIQLWMYGTPIVYPLSLVPDSVKPFLAINPMVSIIEQFRYAFLGAGTVNFQYIIIGWIVTLFVFITGIIIFNKIEKNFMDTI